MTKTAKFLSLLCGEQIEGKGLAEFTGWGAWGCGLAGCLERAVTLRPLMPHPPLLPLLAAALHFMSLQSVP